MGRREKMGGKCGGVLLQQGDDWCRGQLCPALRHGIPGLFLRRIAGRFSDIAGMLRGDASSSLSSHTEIPSSSCQSRVPKRRLRRSRSEFAAGIDRCSCGDDTIMLEPFGGAQAPHHELRGLCGCLSYGAFAQFFEFAATRVSVYIHKTVE